MAAAVRRRQSTSHVIERSCLLLAVALCRCGMRLSARRSSSPIRPSRCGTAVTATLERVPLEHCRTSSARQIGAWPRLSALTESRQVRRRRTRPSGGSTIFLGCGCRPVRPRLPRRPELRRSSGSRLPRRHRPRHERRRTTSAGVARRQRRGVRSPPGWPPECRRRTAISGDQR